jgi:hypothetical protein
MNLPVVFPLESENSAVNMEVYYMDNSVLFARSLGYFLKQSETARVTNLLIILTWGITFF